MKEIAAIIRSNKIQRTKDALVAAGYPAMMANEVLGRGKQRGLQHEFCHDLPAPEGDDDLQPQVSFIPKRLLTLIVEDECVDALVELIIEVNQTGNVGDGKIVVSPVTETVRVRTRETGKLALS
ncbi:MAG: P-II family nitrogen regulator [Thermoleophilia bacterium]